MLFRFLLASFCGLALLLGKNWAQPAVPNPILPSGLDWQFVRSDALAAVWFNLEELRQNRPLQELVDAEKMAYRFRLGTREQPLLPWKTVTQCYLRPLETNAQTEPHEVFVDCYTGQDGTTREMLLAEQQAYINKRRSPGDSGPEIVPLRVPELPGEILLHSRKPAAEIGDEWRKRPVLMKSGEQRLFVGARGDVLVRLLVPGATPAPWTKLLPLQKLNEATIVGALDLTEYRKLNLSQQLNLIRWPYDQQAIYGGLHVLQDKVDQLVWGVTLRDGAQFVAIAQCPDETAATGLRQLLDSFKQGLEPAIPAYLTQLSQLPTQRALAEVLVQDMRQGLQSIEVLQRGNLVRLSFQFPQRVFESLLAIRKDVALQADSTKNARRLTMAMLNRAQAYHSYPAAVTFTKASGTPVSWRVLLLPDLGEKKLFEEYNQNEPWDSEQNKKVLAQMPAIYRATNAPPDSTTTHYVVLTHKGGLFPLATPEMPARVAQRMVQDGTSNTLMFVEAAEGVPWTKPEDLAIADPPTIPKLGAGEGTMFLAAFGDGSLRRLPRTMDDKLFANLLLRNDGGAPNFKELYPAIIDGLAFPTLALNIPQGPQTHQKQVEPAQKSEASTKAGSSAKTPSASSTKDPGPVLKAPPSDETFQKSAPPPILKPDPAADEIKKRDEAFRKKFELNKDVTRRKAIELENQKRVDAARQKALEMFKKMPEQQPKVAEPKKSEENKAP